MNIGIDIDGVLTNIQGFNQKHAPPFFMKKFNRPVVDATPYDIRDIFQCPKHEYHAYWKRYLFTYALFEPARKDAKAVTQQLRKENHKIYIITKRVFTCHNNFMGKLMRGIVRYWLWRNGITYDEIVFCDNDIPDSKHTACEAKKIHIMVDDEAVNINAIAPIAKVICFNASYNRDCEGENIYRARDFNEVYEHINNKEQI
ncbi:MAG: hypothetical protein FWC16_08435 [Defluviitaleaceae bacterium]|nr:hypothetical protein [Defluviitaleaceae bacterium]MCL2274937.1 hypothetical protein [Defluviitaleaceae bacterium]